MKVDRTLGKSLRISEQNEVWTREFDQIPMNLQAI